MTVAQQSAPTICFVGLGNLPVLAREYGHHRVGGAELQQTLLAKALAAQGYDVSMVVADYGQPDGATWDGIKTYKAYRPAAACRAAFHSSALDGPVVGYERAPAPTSSM
jgi:hypothetical protein